MKRGEFKNRKQKAVSPMYKPATVHQKLQESKSVAVEQQKRKENVRFFPANPIM